MHFDFSNKKVLVCGASQGIGKAIALKFAELNAVVTLASRNEEKLQKILQDNSEFNLNYLSIDFENYPASINIVNDKIQSNGGFDIIINNSGGPAPGKLIEADIEEFQNAFNSHLFFSHILMQTNLPYMKSKRFGRFINVISVGLKQPVENLGVSNTLRGAMGAWAKTLSQEVAIYGITVNNLLPGQIKTERLDNLIINQAKIQDKTTEEVLNSMIKNIPAGKIGSPDDLANAAIFLSSNFASFINGINLPIDGGFLKTL